MHPLSGKKIVFMPGMDGTGITFEPFGKVLPQDVDVKVVRYPSDRLLDFEETVQCAAEQIQSYREDVIVIAESFSGPVAVALIASGQLKAKCLILCSTFARAPRPILYRLLCLLPFELLIKLPFPRFILKHVMEGGEKSVDLFYSLWIRVKQIVPPKTLLHRLKVINRIDVRELLPKLTIPCLYIQATSDRSVPASCLIDFIERISDLRVNRIKGPHFILQAEPQLSLEAIENFVGLISGLRAYQ